MTDWIIDCRGLTKSFGDFVALADCDLQVPSGSIVGLLGPNGAGKTTLLRTLLGFQRPSGGKALVCGYDCVQESLKVRQQIAYLPGDARLFRSLTGRGILEIFSGLSPHGDLARSQRAAERLDLDLRRRVMFMSTGMRQKLALAIVLGSIAPLVILDEPTANLDPNVRGEVIQMVREIRQSGRTAVMSSHIFSDIEDTCNDVVILRGGRLVHTQCLSELDELHLVLARIADDANDSLPESWPEFVKQHTRTGPSLELQLNGPPQAWLEWLGRLPLTDMRIERANIRSIYERFHRGNLTNNLESKVDKSHVDESLRDSKHSKR